jgi:hypothetical protein
MSGDLALDDDLWWAASSWAFYPLVERTAPRLPAHLEARLDLVSRAHLGILSLDDFSHSDARLVASELLSTVDRSLAAPGEHTRVVELSELQPMLVQYLQRADARREARPEEYRGTCEIRVDSEVGRSLTPDMFYRLINRTAAKLQPRERARVMEVATSQLGLLDFGDLDPGDPKLVAAELLAAIDQLAPEAGSESQADELVQIAGMVRAFVDETSGAGSD